MRGLRCLLLITGVVILVLCVVGTGQHQAAITVTNVITNVAKTVLSLVLDGGYSDAVQVDIKLGETRTTRGTTAAATGPYSQWASWVPHLCPHHLRRTTLPPGLNLTWEPPTERTIFFTQTSCTSTLTPREACAVESTALHHPGHPLLLLITSPTINHTHPLMQVVLGLAGVRVAWLDLDQVMNQPPLDVWHTHRLWMINTERASAFVSDVVRTELLRRYGGIYLDLDFITLRPLPIQPLTSSGRHSQTGRHHTPRNWLAWADHRLVTLAISSFTKGHWLLENIVADIPRVFEPDSCCSIGPDLVTRHLYQRCSQNLTTQQNHFNQSYAIGGTLATDNNTHIITQTPHTKNLYSLVGQECNGTTVFPKTFFYPVHYGYGKGELKSIFTEGAGLGETFFSKSTAFTLHHYNSLSARALVSPAGDSILREAFRRNCPRVFQLLDEAHVFF
ncbi:hypothetical protein Pcinc_028186 [Petrolisthes cinctipes]|uniref:Alpha 1,4-glycosyltransferase domain-containing protein n=1 Tax=Petrolisthes cinctipes TaxID=88211 RepID=A0AAE1F2K8_PETCI|nr:hypothetical protein Pcinc_028186 [Petrolisthes cinctipes]